MRYEFKSLSFATVLIALNIGFMGLISFTPLANLTSYLFQYLIIGVLFFGALLTGGVYLAKRGVKNRNPALAVLGTVILQLAYGIFGGGILSILPARLLPAAIAITFVLTTLIALVAGLLVYVTGRNFKKWGGYANYIFLGVIGLSLFGTFLPMFEPIIFLLVIAGFFVYLVYEIWNMKEQNAGPYLNGVGIYVAFMGVFVEILQLVVRMLLEE